ncbi:Rep family protein [Ligilactobacillus agilis]|uniref:Rep family protein n=1 Tax=Ligilactobacillus agilis TaxID=1601 RepID=UPI00254A4022|nr:Rep family protein [Ligilactobacillus agilis]MDK6810570.1 Rep family protein [Ligilactobacillus agilis]
MKKTVRARQFMYTQDIEHLPFKQEDLKELLEKSNAEQWAYILHDKDVNEKGEPIRPHFHVILKFKDAKTISRIAKLFNDQQQYVEVWHNTINNGYSYLIHETTNAKNKHHYDPSEVVASFDFVTRIKQIREKVNKPSRHDIENFIDDYSNEQLTKEELQEKIGVLEMAKHKTLLDHIEDILAYKKHQRFLKDFKGQKCTTYWIWGSSGIGKTKLVREVLEELHPNNFIILGSQRDHFQEYKCQEFIVINDIRPNDYDYGQLLTLLDPWEIDKMAPARYHDRYLNARSIYITTPYDPLSFYFECNISNQVVDSFEQLKRRIVSLKLIEDTYSDLKNELIKDEEIAEAIWKIKSQKNTSHADSDKSND